MSAEIPSKEPDTKKNLDFFFPKVSGTSTPPAKRIKLEDGTSSTVIPLSIEEPELVLVKEEPQPAQKTTSSEQLSAITTKQQTSTLLDSFLKSSFSSPVLFNETPSDSDAVTSVTDPSDNDDPTVTQSKPNNDTTENKPSSEESESQITKSNNTYQVVEVVPEKKKDALDSVSPMFAKLFEDKIRDMTEAGSFSSEFVSLAGLFRQIYKQQRNATRQLNGEEISDSSSEEDDDESDDDQEEEDEFNIFSRDIEMELTHDQLLKKMEESLSNGNPISPDTPRVTISHKVASQLKMDLWMKGPYMFVQQYLYSAHSMVTPAEVLAALSFPLPEHLVTRSNADDLIQFAVQATKFTVMPRKRSSTPLTIDSLVKEIENAKNVIVLTGAGISTSLGIPDFRSKSGLYNKLSYLGLSDPQEVFYLSTFKKDPSIFYSIAKEILPVTSKFSPTHSFIKLLQDKGKLLRNYTQNIDNLEYYAGVLPEKLIQCHGSFAFATCQTCGYKTKGETIFEDIRNQVVARCPVCKKQAAKSLLQESENNNNKNNSKPNSKKKNKSSNTWDDSGSESDDNPKFTDTSSHFHMGGKVYGILDPKNKSEMKYRPTKSSRSTYEHYGGPMSISANMRKSPLFGVMKPDITFFGEPLPHTFEETLIGNDSDKCDLLLCIGTSLKVSPVSETVRIIPSNVTQVYISKTAITHNEFELTLLGACDDVIEHLVRKLGWEFQHPMLKNIDMDPYIEYKADMATYEFNTDHLVNQPQGSSASSSSSSSTSSNTTATSNNSSDNSSNNNDTTTTK